PAGRAVWVQAFQSGASESDVIAGFLASDEYRINHPDTASFVQGLYQDVLGRVPDALGQAFWAAYTDGLPGRAGAAAAFLNSTEADLRLLDGYYASFLGRPGDAGEQIWLALLQTKQFTPTQVAEAFLGSDEFFLRAILGTH